MCTKLTIMYYFADDGTIMWRWQYTHIIDEFKHHNINVIVVNPNDYDSLETANKAITNHVDNGKIDLFMSSHNEDYLFVSTLEGLARKGIPRLLLMFDNLLQPYKCAYISKWYDLAMGLNPDDIKKLQTIRL